MRDTILVLEKDVKENRGKDNIFDHRIVRLIIFFIFLGGGVRLDAVMIRLPLSFLVEQSDVIVLGQVEDVRCEWSLDGKLILTVARIRLQDVWKGSVLPAVFYVETQGGTIGELTLRVSDTPHFRMGEHVCLFLQPVDKSDPGLRGSTVSTSLFSSYAVFGSAQGKWSVDEEELARRGDFKLAEPGESHDDVVPLSVLKQRVLTEKNRILSEKAAGDAKKK